MALKGMGLVPLIIDINDDIIKPLFAKEGDYRSRGIELQILNKGKEIDTSGIIVEFFAKPRDGKVYVVEATPVDATKGKYEIVYPSSILQPGVVQCEIRLVKMTDDEIDEIITTKSFNLKVYETIVNEDIFEGIDIEPIVEILVQAAINEEKRIQAENERIQAENERIQAENERIQAENVRQSNENIRQSNEQTRQQNEDIRQQNEQDRIDLYNTLKDLDVSQYELRLQEAENNIENLQGDLNSHLEDTNNPHNVTPDQIGAETPAGAQAKVDALAGEGNTKTVRQLDNELSALAQQISDLLSGGEEYTATLQNGWSGNLTYRKNLLGQVVLSGQLTAGDTAATTQICVLPSGFRPKHMLAIPAYNGTQGVVGTAFQLSASGILYPRSGANINLSSGNSVYIHIIFSTI